MYAAIRQGKAKTGTAEELARRIKEGAIPIISDVPGFQAYYVIYAPDDTVTAISIFDDYAGAQESNRRGLAWIEQNLSPLLTGTATAVAGPVIVHTLAQCNAREAAEADRRDPLYNGMVDHGKMGLVSGDLAGFALTFPAAQPLPIYANSIDAYAGGFAAAISLAAITAGLTAILPSRPLREPAKRLDVQPCMPVDCRHTI